MLLWTCDDLGCRDLAVPLKMRMCIMDVTWEDTACQRTDSRPGRQKTGQKKVTLFANYWMVFTKNL